jgi:AcrR family transcriptional regulator
MTSGSYDRIVEAATRLFADKGYHGTSMRDIAREVGLHVATVQQHVGSKAQLYNEVFHRQYEEEHKIVKEILDRYDVENQSVILDAAFFRKVLREIWKQMNRRFFESPYLVRLWVYRLLERDELALEIDKKYSLSLYKIGMEYMEKARQSKAVNPDQAAWLLWMSGFAWLQMGYFAGRNLLADWGEGDPLSKEIMEKFNEFVDVYADRMIDFDA